MKDKNIALPEDQNKKLAVGHIISFFCNGFTNKHIPIDPTIYRIRYDLELDDVVRAKQQRLPGILQEIYTIF